MGLPVTPALDNARYQRRAAVQQLAKELRVEFLFLPADAPNLDRIERLWKFVKEECPKELRVEFLFLPADAPNLDRIERLWKFVKEECLSGRHREDFARFEAAIVACLDEVEGKHRLSIESLLTLNLQTFEKPQLRAG